MLDFDFFEVLDSLTIARSRKHIATYYDTSTIGKFPKRNRPFSIESPLTEDQTLTYEEVAQLLSELNLSVYSPLKYILPSQLAKYAERYDKKTKNGKFRQVDREKSLKVLMRINLLKRIESSIDSFRITTNGIVAQIENTIKALSKDGLEDLVSPQFDTENENFDWDTNWGDEENVFGKKVKVHLADIDRRQWKEDLEEDLSTLNELLKKVNTITPIADYKLQKLIANIKEKIENPLNSNNKKVIVFTAFADTAGYLYNNLGEIFKNEYQINTALITGSKRVTTAKSIPTELNALLTCFSPQSKDKDLVFPTITEDIDILIATDCISEGQNLQDCDYLINYDIHWNPVRIIQRFGRIDRIGSTNESITLVNFWPDITLDNYINLKQRVEDRMLISDMASTADDNILKENQKDLEYRKIQLKKLQDEVTDLEDLREGIDITDLGLNDFRIDLSNFIKEYGEMVDIPEGIHAVFPSTEILKPGVIYVLKNINENININKLNRLHPFYLVYINNEGELIYSHIDSKKILDAIRMLSKGIKEPIASLCEQLNTETQEYHNMYVYSELLKKSIATILETEDEKDVMSLFKSGGTHVMKEKFKGIEDFKLISFLIIK